MSDTSHSFIVAHITNAQSSVQTGKIMLLITLDFSERIKKHLQRFPHFAVNT